jgi:SAM-dependent methyltransferase
MSSSNIALLGDIGAANARFALYASGHSRPVCAHALFGGIANIPLITRMSVGQTMTYNPESYWSRVGEEIEKRTGDNVVAGDDNPYYAYKRSKFLRRFLDTIDFQSKTIMEVGFGPGGNLRHIASHRRPQLILGADISQTMYDIARRNLRSFGNIKLAKIDGAHLPFDDRSVDLSFTVTVLQHVTNADMLKSLVKDICRVTRDTVVIMEDIGHHEQLGGEGAGVNRTVGAYKGLFAEHGFQLRDTQFLNTKVSRGWYEFAWRAYHRVLARNHHEGDRINALGKLSIGLPLFVTRALDDVLTEDQNLAKLTFARRP